MSVGFPTCEFARYRFENCDGDIGKRNSRPRGGLVGTALKSGQQVVRPINGLAAQQHGLNELRFRSRKPAVHSGRLCGGMGGCGLAG
jgi:hypothetical protein